MTTKAYSSASRTIDAIRAARAEFEAERRAIQANPNYSDSFKQKLVAQARAYAEGKGYVAAADGWEDYQKGKREARAAVGRATLARDEGINPHMVMLKTEEFRTALRTAPGDAARLKVLDRLLGEAQYSRETRRALNLAAADLLQSGDFAQQASRARQTLAAWTAEEDALVVEAQRQAESYEAIEPELRRVILDEETGIKGQPRYSGMISEWQARIFQESHESLAHVVWRDDTSEYMKQAVPTPAAPGGVGE